MDENDYKEYINSQSIIKMIIEDYEFYVKNKKDYESFGAGVADILEMNHLIEDE